MALLRGQVISPEQFIDEVNRRLPDHHMYAPGMKVFLVPRGATGQTASGYDFEGPNDDTVGVVANVADHVKSLYHVDPDLKVSR